MNPFCSLKQEKKEIQANVDYKLKSIYKYFFHEKLFIVKENFRYGCVCESKSMPTSDISPITYL